MVPRSIPGGKEAKRVADYSSPPKLRIQEAILLFVQRTSNYLRAIFYRMVSGLKISSKIVRNVAYFLKARTVEAEKQPLLGNARTQQYRRPDDT
jgi:hypothetical protein